MINFDEQPCPFYNSCLQDKLNFFCLTTEHFDCKYYKKKKVEATK